MVKKHVMLGSTIVTNEVLYPLLHNLPGIGEVISTEALMNLDINHDQKSLKNLGWFKIYVCVCLYLITLFMNDFLFRNYMGFYCRSLYSVTRHVYNTS